MLVILKKIYVTKLANRGNALEHSHMKLDYNSTPSARVLFTGMTS